MRLFEILDTNIEHHPELNHLIWDGETMSPEVREAILKVVMLFYMDLKVPELKIDDIILTGSLANYNWSKYSDLDVHIVVDMTQFGENEEIFNDYFMTKKALWNKIHDISISGFDIEMYVQDKNEPHHSSGVYSIAEGKWLDRPTNTEPEFKDDIIKRKVRSIAKIIDMLNSSCEDVQDIIRVKDKIKNMRQDGLDSSGEFSIGNLVYKVLRNNGYIEKLYDKYNAATDSCYTI